MGRPRADDTEPIAVMRANDLEPLDPYPGSKPQWRSQCTRCGKEVLPRLCNVRKGHRNCTTCFVDPRIAPAAEAEADMRAAGLTPLVPYPGKATRPWPCKCDGCGNETSPTLSNIRQGQGGCWPCGTVRSALSRRKDEAEAVALMRSVNLEPLEPYPTTMVPWKCRCTSCGDEVTPTHNMVSHGTGGCGRCGRTKNAKARMRDADEAERTMLDAGLVPQVRYPGVAIPWPSTCLGCSGTVKPRLGSILAGQGGCKPCTWSLNRPGASAGVYLVWHPQLRAIKVGVGVAFKGKIKRAEEHRRRGWSHDTVITGLLTMRPAFDAERAVLDDWAARGIDSFLEPRTMPHGGWTETAPYSPSELARCRAIIAATLASRESPGEAA